MQQYPRGSPRLAPRPGSPNANTSRYSNQRDQLSDRGSDFESISYSGRMSGEGSVSRPLPVGDRSAEQEKDIAKLKQITQRFFTKAALTIISSRLDLPQDLHRDTMQVRTNKWFNLILDESDQLAEELGQWATVDVTERRPKPLIIEIYLDTSDLARNQTLVVVDERGSKWDVRKTLDVAAPTSIGRSRGSRSTEIVLERWNISVGEPGPSSAFADSPPNVYKKAVVLFRALYSYLHLMPAWKLGRRLAKEPASLTSLRPMYRILNGEPAARDTLTLPLYPANEPVADAHVFPATRCPTGQLNLQVSYRTNCDFRLDDAEALLSSHFMGIDDQSFQPSLTNPSTGEATYWAGGKDAGSLPSERKWLKAAANATQQAYGSLSTFHNTGAGTGTSPLSALRAAGNLVAGSPPGTPPQRIPPDHRTSISSKSSLKSAEGAPPTERRVSISFQPFKAGSLSSSPGYGPVGPSSPRTVGAGSSDISKALAQSRHRTSLTSLPQTALRTPPPRPTSEIVTGSPSPNSALAKPPITRYSSSFSNRKSRFSSGSAGASRTEEDNNSSVRGSQSSSNQPGSGLLAEGGSGSSSGRTDEDNIADFLKLLDTKKDLHSFSNEDSARDNSAKRTTAALNKYQRLRDSHSVLTDSMTSSMMVPRSSSSSGRGPPMLVGNSVSTSSSPGKPISPHTPHYPAIPSRLSANSTIEYVEPSSGRDQARLRRGRRESSPEDGGSASRSRGHGTTPMDIPTSPQRYPLNRRSSSAAQRRRAIEELEEFGLRSSSLPLEDRQDLSLSELLVLQQQESNVPGRSQRGNPMRMTDPRQPIAEAPGSSSMESQESGRPIQSTSVSSISQFRSRLRGGGGRGSPSSFGGGSGESSRAGRTSALGRPSTADDDEPLVFTMSELGAQSRRGGEDLDGSSDAGRNERGTGEGLTGRRGSRRGGTLW